MAELDAEKLGAFKGALMNVCAGSLAFINLGVGDALGLYKCLAANNGLTPAELAEKNRNGCSIHRRLVCQPNVKWCHCSIKRGWVCWNGSLFHDS